MKLFIERLLEMFVVVILVTLLSSEALIGIKIILGIVVVISILIAAGSFINWLIIEPFFTKKGVDRK